MKRMIALAVTILMIFASVSAQGETPLRLMYDSIFSLLFDTDNVTLAGHAEFFLDGDRFKTADAKYIQDGNSSFWEWILHTPRRDGSERESGYTVIANGEKVYVMETYYPGVYKTGTTADSRTILRSSVQLNLLRDMLRILADQSDELLGESAVQTVKTDASGMEVRLQSGGDVPEIVNTVLNMTFQFAAKRYFFMDYDYISERYMGSMDHYITVTQGILGSTYYIGLDSADFTIKRDSVGNFESVNGELSFALNTEADGLRILRIAFRLDASDRGVSSVKRFDPDDYGVSMADGAMDLDFPEMRMLDPETERNYLEISESWWQLAGYAADETMTGSAIMEVRGPDNEERIHIEFANEDGSALRNCMMDSVGRMLGLHNLTNNWQGSVDDRHFEEYPDAELIRETEEKLLSYLAEVNPELGADVQALKTDWWYENGGELFLHFWEGGEPVDHAWDEVDFIVRVRPEWRIEFFSCIANG